MIPGQSPASPSVRRKLAQLTLLATILLASGCSDATGPDPWDSGDILDRLNALPGVQAQEIEAYYGYPRAFQLDITQPVDHDRPNGPTFTQRAYLSHASDVIPMVFAPSGYGTTPQSGQELAEIIQANCLNVTHRYFPDARPTNPDWSYLNIWQAAQDHHHIVSLFKEIYQEEWVSTGVSKGGKTAVFHRRFFPDDVDATVAYVAPFMLALDDARFEPYLRTRGTAQERAAIHDFQRRFLARKEELLPLFQSWFTEREYEYSLPPAPGFEGSAVSYEWNYFQRHIFRAEDIPAPGASAQEMVDHLALVVRLHFKSDIFRDYFKAYVYQLYTEIGSPRYEPYHLQDLLVEDGIGVIEKYSFPPELEFPFSPAAIQDVLGWIGTEGTEIIYIYGATDPWTGGAVDLPGTLDALKVVQEGGDHSVKIPDLDLRDLVLARLGGWLGRDLTLPDIPGLLVPPEAAYFGTPDDPTLHLRRF